MAKHVALLNSVPTNRYLSIFLPIVRHLKVSHNFNARRIFPPSTTLHIIFFTSILLPKFTCNYPRTMRKLKFSMFFVSEEIVVVHLWCRLLQFIVHTNKFMKL